MGVRETGQRKQSGKHAGWTVKSEFWNTSTTVKIRASCGFLWLERNVQGSPDKRPQQEEVCLQWLLSFLWNMLLWLRSWTPCNPKAEKKTTVIRVTFAGGERKWCFYLFVFFILCFTYLRGRERVVAPRHCVTPQMPAMPGAGFTWSQRLRSPSGSLTLVAGPEPLWHHLLPARVSISRKLVSGMEIRFEPRLSNIHFGCSIQLPKCPPQFNLLISQFCHLLTTSAFINYVDTPFGWLLPI